MTDNLITVPKGVIAPRPVRPLTAEEKAQVAALVTTESLSRLVRTVNTRDTRRSTVASVFPQRKPVTTAYYTDPTDNANANVTVQVFRGSGKSRLSAKAAKSASKRG